MPDPLTTPAAELPVRRLGPGDLDRCLALGADRNWGPEDTQVAVPPGEQRGMG